VIGNKKKGFCGGENLLRLNLKTAKLKKNTLVRGSRKKEGELSCPREVS